MRFASSAAAFLTAALVPCSAVYAADSTKIGYGQGTTLDEKGRPADAVSFNQRYSDLEAYALTNDDDRIIITFDQGYENGYTEKILDILPYGRLRKKGDCSGAENDRRGAYTRKSRHDPREPSGAV